MWTWTTHKHPNPAALSSISYLRCWYFRASEPTLGHSCALTHPKFHDQGLPCQGFIAQGGTGDESRHCPEWLLKRFSEPLRDLALMSPQNAPCRAQTALPQVWQHLGGALVLPKSKWAFVECSWSGALEEKPLWWPCSCLAAWQNKLPISVWIPLLSYDTKGKLP